MTPDQETDQEIERLRSEAYQRYEKIASLLLVLNEKGWYIVNERPSAIENDYFIELESNVNDLYRNLYRDYNDDYGVFNKEALTTVIESIEEEILGAVSAWSDYARENPEGERPEGLFKTIKRIGRKLAELSGRLA